MARHCRPHMGVKVSNVRVCVCDWMGVCVCKCTRCDLVRQTNRVVERKERDEKRKREREEQRSNINSRPLIVEAYGRLLSPRASWWGVTARGRSWRSDKTFSPRLQVWQSRTKFDCPSLLVVLRQLTTTDEQQQRRLWLNFCCHFFLPLRYWCCLCVLKLSCDRVSLDWCWRN